MGLTPDKIPGNQLYALDTVALIYFLERHPRHYEDARKLLHRIEAGEISAVVSTLLFAELLVPAFRLKKKQLIEKTIHSVTNFPNLTVAPLTIKISCDAARLRAVYGLRTSDAIHAATALDAKAAGFVTNDKEIRKIATDEFSIWLFDG